MLDFHEIGNFFNFTSIRENTFNFLSQTFAPRILIMQFGTLISNILSFFSKIGKNEAAGCIQVNFGQFW